jgi:hypothetical protein
MADGIQPQRIDRPLNGNDHPASIRHLPSITSLE